MLYYLNYRRKVNNLMGRTVNTPRGQMMVVGQDYDEKTDKTRVTFELLMPDE